MALYCYAASICFLLLLFFIAVILETRSAQALDDRTGENIKTSHNLKSSALAVLLHGLDQRSLDQMKDVSVANDVKEIEAASKTRKVRFDMTDQGLKLVVVE